MSARTGARNRYVALLRGINVGRAKQLPMADLKALLEGLGYDEVKTHLRSGQAVFTAPGKAGSGPAAARRAATIERDIERAISSELSLDVPVLLRSRAELADIVQVNPFLDSEPDLAKLFCVFLSERVSAPALKAVDAATYAPEEFALAPDGREIFLWLPGGMGTSKLGLLKWSSALNQRELVVTARNWRTTLKLLELLDA